MNAFSFKSVNLRRLLRIGTLTLAALTVFFSVSGASASCGNPFGRKPGSPVQFPAQMLPATGSDTTNSSIVGMWHVTYTSGGQLAYEALDQWHSDGTEFEIANVPPETGNVCMGVWRQDGPAIKLNHEGWAFDGAGNAIGPFTITEYNLVRGDAYRGTFDFKQYDSSGNVLYEFSGTVSATRITVN